MRALALSLGAWTPNDVGLQPIVVDAGRFPIASQYLAALPARKPAHFVVDLRYPSFLYEHRLLANMSIAVTAALDAAGAHAPQIATVDIGETRARFDIR